MKKSSTSSTPTTENTQDPGQLYPGSPYVFGRQPMPRPPITADPAANAMSVALIPPASNPPTIKVGPPPPHFFTADKE